MQRLYDELNELWVSVSDKPVSWDHLEGLLKCHSSAKLVASGPPKHTIDDLQLDSGKDDHGPSYNHLELQVGRSMSSQIPEWSDTEARTRDRLQDKSGWAKLVFTMKTRSFDVRLIE